jgi:methyltransferase FkbM-like protein
LAERGCKGYLFDHTVDGLPIQHPNLHFSKEGVGASNDPALLLAPISEYIRRNGDEHRTDLLLKMDVEGSEYAALSSISDSTLRCFSLIALEVHWLNRLTEEVFCQTFTRVFRTLKETLKNSPAAGACIG